MSDDQKNPPAQPEFGELAPEGWSWNPEANAPHTPETLKAAEAVAKAAAKAKAATAATNAKAAERGSAKPSLLTPATKPAKPAKIETSENQDKPAKAPKAAPAIFVAPPAAGSEPDTAGQHTPTQTLAQQSLSEDEQKTRAVAVAKLASDRFITWGLLGVAVFSVVSGLGDYVNLTRTLNAAFDQLNTMEPGLNLAPYSNPGLAKVLGWGIVLTQAVIIGLTFWWAIRRMRAGKMAFWVPVVGFAISSAAVLGFMIFAFVADPTAWNALVTYIQTVPSVAPTTGSTT
ncbi:MAG: hypothetical protein JJE28_01010 [Actinomycetales bacterium]|nr:hypothetical protein [Actinomycetales bacterium]